MPPPNIVAILNVTPDSFVDGGTWNTPKAALERARQCVEEGADIIEIGGESTGPGSPEVSSEEELQRVLPVLRLIRDSFPEVRLSVDTYKALVASECVKAGASMINDVTAGRGDNDMFKVMAESRCDYVFMYAKDHSPRTTREERHYENVIVTVMTFLRERRAEAITAGIAPEHLIVDPGLGHFVSSDPQYSYHILRELRAFTALGRVFISPSRKSFLAGNRQLSVSERLPATLAASIIAAQNGASFIRTHDVAQTKSALDLLSAVQH